MPRENPFFVAALNADAAAAELAGTDDSHNADTLVSKSRGPFAKPANPFLAAPQPSAPSHGNPFGARENPFGAVAASALAPEPEREPEPALAVAPAPRPTPARPANPFAEPL